MPNDAVLQRFARLVRHLLGTRNAVLRLQAHTRRNHSCKERDDIIAKGCLTWLCAWRGRAAPVPRGFSRGIEHIELVLRVTLASQRVAGL